MRFSFCGEWGQLKDKPLIEEGASKNGMPYVKLKFSVRSGSDRVVVEAFASKQDVLHITDRQQNKLDVAWEDRFDEEIIRNASRTYTCNLGERKTFLSQYDQIRYLAEKLPEFKGRIIVTGRLNKSYYNGNWYDNYQIQNVYAAEEGNRSRLYMQGEIIFNRDSVDTSVYKKDGILTLNGYIEQYMDKDHPNALIPQTFVLNVSRLNPEDEKQKYAIGLRELYLKPLSKGWTKTNWEMVQKNGQEEIEWDPTQLTEAQQMALKSGEYTLDDFKPTKRIYGERINQIRLYRPILRDEYTAGPIAFGDDATVEALIYRPGQVIQTVAEDDVLGIGASDVDDLFA